LFLALLFIGSSLVRGEGGLSWRLAEKLLGLPLLKSLASHIQQAITDYLALTKVRDAVHRLNKSKGQSITTRRIIAWVSQKAAVTPSDVELNALQFTTMQDEFAVIGKEGVGLKLYETVVAFVGVYGA
jgi:hypothetical protein